MVDQDDKIAKAIHGMGPVSIDEHEALKTRVYKLADDLAGVTLQQARLEGRVDQSQQSIERLRMSSATAEQVTSLTTVTTLKLDHLLEKQQEMKTQIGNIPWRLAVWSLIGGCIAVGLALFMGWIVFT